MKHDKWLGAALLVVSLLTPIAAYPQGTQGAIVGVLTDQSGAVIPNVKVAVKNEATGEIRATVTNASGSYTASNLNPGTYDITATAQGFQTLIRKGIILPVGAQQVMNLTLRLGKATQQMEVTGGAPTVQLVSSVMRGDVNSTTMRQLPLNGRDWTSLAFLQPGVTDIPTQRREESNAAQRGFGTQAAIAGSRPSENTYMVDGIAVNDYANTGPGSALGVNLGVDAISEFTVLTDTYAAEYGRGSGGVFNAVTKSGTNAIHGDGFFFFRNSGLDARNFFDEAIPPFRRQQFGSSIGGPIQKDRTFAFFDWELLRQNKGISTVSVVPSMSARLGLLSTGPVTVDPAVQKALTIYPLPNAGLLGNGDTGLFSFGAGNVGKEDYYAGRVDHVFSDKDNLFGTYFFDGASLTIPDEFDNKSVGARTRRQEVTLHETHSFSPYALNALRLGFSRTFGGNGLSFTVFNPLLLDPSLGFVPGKDIGLLRVSGLTDFTGSPDAQEFNLFRWNSYQGYDDVIVTKGIHTIQFGVAVERDQDNMIAPFTPAGEYDFASLADFLTNVPETFSALLPGSDVVRGVRQTIVGGYIQDNVRVRPYLTANLGFRYETATSPTEAFNRFANLRNITGPQPTVGQFIDPSHNNFSPRVGFAWDPFHNGRTSVRGAFGIYDVLPLAYNFANQFPRTPPFFENGVTTTGLTGTYPAGGFALLTPGTFRSISTQFHTPRAYVEQWNFNIQHEVLPNLTVQVGYVGSHGVHIVQTLEDADIVPPITTASGFFFPASGTRINTNFGRIEGHFWSAGSFYDALQINVVKRWSRGLQLQGNYTFSKSVDDGSTTFSTDEFSNTIGNPLSIFDPTFNRGLSDFDVRNRGVINGVWAIPTPISWQGARRWALGGWEVTGIATFATGTPFSPVLASDRALTQTSRSGADLGERPNLVLGPGCSNPTTGNVNGYINLSCFAFPAAGTVGTLGRNTLIGPGFANYDWGLFKNTPVRRISENFNIQFRVEFFNAFNRPNFDIPSRGNVVIFDKKGNIPGSAGILTQTRNDSREIQFGLKVIW